MKASLVFIGILAFITMLFLTQRIIVPVIYATIIAIVLTPAVDFFTRKKVHRVVAITLVLFLVILIIVFLALLLSSQMMVFSDSFPALVTKFHQLSGQMTKWVSGNFHISTYKIRLWISEKNAEMISNAGASLGQTLINTGNMLVVLILLPVYTFMILYYQPLLLQFIHRVFCHDNQSKVNEVLSATKKIIRSYLTGLLMEAVIVATLNSISLLILGIDYAILLGVTGAILNVIPYIGGVIAVALPVMIALATKTPMYALLVLASYVLIQFIDNHFIIPKVVASRVKINALVSIIAVLAGGALWGISGMFLSIPLTAVVKVIFDHIEPMKPWGYLLGDTMPPVLKIRLPFRNKKTVTL